MPADIGLALRKIVLLLKPDKEIDHQGNHMTVKMLSTFRNYVLKFEVGVEFEEDLRIVDGRKCQVRVLRLREGTWMSREVPQQLGAKQSNLPQPEPGKVTR